MVRDFEDLGLPEVIADRTRVIPEAEGGVRRAFSLSLADVQHLSVTPGIGFMRTDSRISDGGGHPWWWLRTPSSSDNHWAINGGSGGLVETPTNVSTVFVRPSIIIRQ